MTEAQRRILEDFADLTHTRHTRSTQNERNDVLPELLKLGWLAEGSVIAGWAHYVTDAGHAALKGTRS